MGPDGFCWGRDFLDRDLAGKPGAAHPLVMQKQWYSFTLWGRLSYDPTLPDTLFIAMLAARFKGVDAERLFVAARSASKVIPKTTTFFWRDIDIRWLPEACVHNARHGLKPQKEDTGAVFYTVDDFMNGETAPDMGILNIRDWRKRVVSGQPLIDTSPLDMADAIGGAAEEALHAISDVRRTMPSSDAIMPRRSGAPANWHCSTAAGWSSIGSSPFSICRTRWRHGSNMRRSMTRNMCRIFTAGSAMSTSRR
jgi:hypothetical protein